jgi:glycerol-3-phosphate dehydrogenase
MVRLERDTNKLATEEFDLLIVGAGIFGAAAAWDAALRGYKVALVEQEDFGCGVSANSYKIVHGGIRYMQHLDIPRVRSSCHERSTFLKIAPHLIHPLPIAMPTYGYGMSGKPILSTGMLLYDLLTADRNRGISDDERKISWAERLSKAEILNLFPGLETRGLTGAALFSDAQIYNPPRLVLAFLQSAVGKGASICNHAKVTGFEISRGSVKAANVLDTLSGDTFQIRAKTYLNAAGPWTDALLNEDPATENSTPGIYSRDACFVVPRRFEHEIAVAIMGQTKDPDAVMSREGRSLFVVPWRDYSLIGTWHKVVPATPDKVGIDRSEIENFINEMHAAYPELGLSADEVRMCNWGLVPFGEDQHGGENLSYGKRSILVDHSKRRGPSNMVSLVGIRYTMGRGDAEWAMKAIAEKLNDRQKRPPTDEIPLYGGDVDIMKTLVNTIHDKLPAGMGDPIAYSLARNYGSNAESLLTNGSEEPIRQIGSSHVIESQVRHAIRNEMAMTIADVVFRRTDMASAGLPGEAELMQCASLVQEELGLSASETENQLSTVRGRIPGW